MTSLWDSFFHMLKLMTVTGNANFQCVQHIIVNDTYDVNYYQTHNAQLKALCQ